ncbi:MAG: winged helix-turn-helix domain-containing protein, partial [Pyrinomonadaceae bacterium]
METLTPKTFLFAEFELDAAKRLLLKKGQAVPLNSKAFDLLFVLLDHHGQVLSKDELLAKVWAGQFVEENNLTVHISAVRKALGERRGENRFLVTVPGRGYSFVGELNDEPNVEIIIESHKVERITVEQSEYPNETTAFKAVNQKTVQNRTAFFLATGALAVCVLGIFGWWLSHRFVFSKSETNNSNQTKLSRLTNNGRVVAVALSPDGKYAVFAQKEADGQSLWLRQIETGSQTRIIEPKSIDYLGLTVSPDQNYVYCATFEANKADPVVFRIPLLGGAAQELPFYSGVAVSFSPDGSKIAFNQSHSSSLKETHLITADADGTNLQILARLPDAERSFNNYQSNAVAWSPDGKLIAAIVEDSVKNDATVAGFDSHTGAEMLLTEKRWAGVSHIAWMSDGEHLTVAAREKDASNNQIWLVSRRTGEARQITNDLSSYEFLATAKNSPTIFATQKNVVSTLYAADFDLRANSLAPRAVLTESSAFDNVEWTPDDNLLYSSSATGKREIWRVETSGANPTPLTVDARVAFGMSFAPDKQKIVFNSWRENGKLTLYIADVDGKNMRPVLDGTEDV